MGKILSSVACNLDTHILNACLPLLEEGKVEAIEWAFDALYQRVEIPGWFESLLQAYSTAGRLVGHGIFFSLFSGKWSPDQAGWLQSLKKACNHYRFDHITEHFGFMSGRDFHHGAPLPVPYNKTVLAIGIDRLKRVADTCRCPVGLENLAFSYSQEEVKRHADFLQQLLEPVNGFMILDLHNIYCQSHNFNIPFATLIDMYPMDLTREIHISGGSWDKHPMAPAGKIRRDTHDDAVPEEVFAMLEHIIPRCAALKFVVLEQLGNGLETELSRKQFYTDFLRMEQIVQAAQQQDAAAATNLLMPPLPLSLGNIIEDDCLYLQQCALSDILETAGSVTEAIMALQNSPLAHTSWHIEKWQPYMIDTAMTIAQKWKKKGV